MRTIATQEQNSEIASGAGIQFISNQTLGPISLCLDIPLQAFLGLLLLAPPFFSFKASCVKLIFERKRKMGVTWDHSTKLIYFSKLLN